jgi:3',5'-cyclic AMP phosphodiesterase CpdA
VRTIVHLSDLHFGRVDLALVKPLITVVRDLAPDVVAVSGDLTQRAHTHEFVEARAFLERLPKPQIVVPGNHDVPLYNLLARFGMPLTKYRLHITSELAPFHSDDEIAIAGVNTARSFTHKGGRINRKQMEAVRAKLCAASEGVVRIIVTHHPFDVPEGHPERDLVGRAEMAMRIWATCGADLFLSGHLHLSQVSQTAKRYKIAGHSAIVVQAGTTTSTRGRGEANAFNVIRTARNQVTIEQFQWEPNHATFARVSIDAFQRSTDGWIRKPAEDAPRTDLPSVDVESRE